MGRPLHLEPKWLRKYPALKRPAVVQNAKNKPKEETKQTKTIGKKTSKQHKTKQNQKTNTKPHKTNKKKPTNNQTSTVIALGH